MKICSKYIVLRLYKSTTKIFCISHSWGMLTFPTAYYVRYRTD